MQYESEKIEYKEKFVCQMIKTTDGDEFEIFPSVEQNLTFEYAKGIFEKNGIDFSEAKYFQLGLKNPESKL